MDAKPPAPDAPPARAHLRVFARRVAREIALSEDALDAFVSGARADLTAAFTAARAVSSLARRASARALDATLLAHELRVALDVPDGAHLPLESRAHALTLTAFRVPLVLEAGRLVTVPGPPPDAPDAAGVARAGLDHLARLRALELEALADEDPEGVHQLRVSIRRLRAVLRLLSRLRPGPQLDATVTTVRALGRVGGAVRDLDVARDLLATVLPPGPALEAAHAHLAARRGAAQTRLRRVLTSARYAAEIVQARAALDELARDAGGDATVADASTAHLARELKRLARDLGADLTEPGAYHEVRRQARRVRDVAEVFRSALRKKDRAWRKRLQPVQGVLGQLNDVDVALALLPSERAALAPARAALAHKRLTVMAELGPPLAVLAIRIWNAAGA